MKKKFFLGLIFLVLVLCSVCGIEKAVSTQEVVTTTASDTWGGVKTNKTQSSEISNPQESIPDSLKVRDQRFAGQEVITQNLQEELDAGYSFDEPLCIVDPYHMSPLTAMVLFTTEEPVTVTVEVRGKDPATTVHHEFENQGPSHMIPVYGLYADTENEINLTIKNNSGKTKEKSLIVKTEPLPEDMSVVEIGVRKTQVMEPGFTFTSCPNNGMYSIAFDSNGDIRWYLSDKTFNGTTMMVYLKNGNFLIGSGSGNISGGDFKGIDDLFEISPMGKVYYQYHIYGLHHDIREKSNGNLICAVSKEGRQTENDYIVEVERKTGKVIRSWDLMEILPMTVYEPDPAYTDLSGKTINWFHNNGICYIEEEDAFIVSGRNQNMVLKFNGETKNIRWILSMTAGERNKKLQPYLLESIGDEFEYPAAQHAATQLPNGDLMLFDNRNFNVDEKNGVLDQEALYSRAVIYKINEADMTVEQVWEYGKERGAELYSSFVSDVDYLKENHYLFDFGALLKDEQRNATDNMANSASRESVIIELLNNEVIFEARLTGNANSYTYKAERRNIYEGIK